jgi:hypothetical protein
VRQLEFKSETGFRFVLKNTNDPQRHFLMTVLAFDMPQ